MNEDAKLLKPELVFFDIEASDAPDLFSKLEPRLREMGYVRESWREAITEREREYPTGLACETARVAIPHTDPKHLVRPYIAVVRPRGAIAFRQMGDPDTQVDAQIVINLGIVRDGGQVQMLQNLMGVFMDSKKSGDVMAQRTPESLARVLGGYLSA